MSEINNENDIKMESEINVTDYMPNPQGRPTVYKEEFDKQVEKLCKLGATDKDIATFFDVCEATINTWKIKHPNFLESISRGKMRADIEVAESLYKLSTGFGYQETVETIDSKGISTTTYKKKALPDFRAQRFWLMNRQSKKWRDKQEIETTNTHEINSGDTLKSIMAEINESITNNISTTDS